VRIHLEKGRRKIQFFVEKGHRIDRESTHISLSKVHHISYFFPTKSKNYGKGLRLRAQFPLESGTLPSQPHSLGARHLLPGPFTLSLHPKEKIKVDTYVPEHNHDTNNGTINGIDDKTFTLVSKCFHRPLSAGKSLMHLERSKHIMNKS